MKNRFQKRLLRNGVKGNYTFYGVPNNSEGRMFMELVKKYKNPAFKYKVQYRRDGHWPHSVNSTDGDSFVVYLTNKQEADAERANEREINSLKEQLLNLSLKLLGELR